MEYEPQNRRRRGRPGRKWIDKFGETIDGLSLKTPLRCKLVIDGKIIHQEMKFKYLGVEISGYGDVETEVREQTNKAARITAYHNNTIWQNKHILYILDREI